MGRRDVGVRRTWRTHGWRACGGGCAGVSHVGTKGRKMAVAGQRLMQQGKVKLIQKECSNYNDPISKSSWLILLLSRRARSNVESLEDVGAKNDSHVCRENDPQAAIEQISLGFRQVRC
jgi:hypothetical protein